MIEGRRAPVLETALTLLASKTKIPFVRQDALVRSRLTSLLTDADTPLSLVVAPAGWGKTTLLAQWARVTSSSHPVGWVTLDATDNEPHRFWSYVITSLRHAGSQVGESALAALEVPRLDPIEVAIPRLLNDFVATDQPHSMVFDDLHRRKHGHKPYGRRRLICRLPDHRRPIRSGPRRLDRPHRPYTRGRRLHRRRRCCCSHCVSGPGVLIPAVALLLVYQLVENFVIAPRVMNRAVDLSPVGVIIAILIGGSLAGFFGPYPRFQ